VRKVEPRQGQGGITYKVRFRLNGKQSSETFRGKGAEAAAKRFARELDALGAAEAVRRLDASARPPEGPTLDEIAEQFFAWKADKVKSDRTVADYRRDYRNWIQPVFGDREADSIDEAQVQEWVDKMGTGALGKKLEPKSVADRHALLHGIYGWAIAPSRKLATTNPCVGTQLPPRRKKPPKGLRPAEWQAFYAALVQTDHDAADLALFLVSTGWRFSEAAALSAYAVEDHVDQMYVSMTGVIRRNARNQYVIVEGGKSDAADRRIKLDAEAAAMVRRRMEKVTGDGLVFTNKGGKQWRASNYRRDAWNPAVELAQLSRKPTPHWLRHTSVAWLVMGGGVSLAEIQRRIGHESIDTTINVYGRMIDDISDDALERFAAFRNQQPKGNRELEP